MADDKDRTDESPSSACAPSEADGGERSAGAPSEDRRDGSAASGERRSAPEASAIPAPAEAFVKGLGLLFQAAVGTAESMRAGVEKAGVPKAFEEMGRQLEGVATAALRGLEQLVRGASPAAAASKPESATAPAEPQGCAEGTSSTGGEGVSPGNPTEPDESPPRSPAA